MILIILISFIFTYSLHLKKLIVKVLNFYIFLCSIFTYLFILFIYFFPKIYQQVLSIFLFLQLFFIILIPFFPFPFFLFLSFHFQSFLFLFITLKSLVILILFLRFLISPLFTKLVITTLSIPTPFPIILTHPIFIQPPIPSFLFPIIFI